MVMVVIVVGVVVVVYDEPFGLSITFFLGCKFSFEHYNNTTYSSIII